MIIIPPFYRDYERRKARLVQDLWNTRNPEKLQPNIRKIPNGSIVHNSKKGGMKLYSSSQFNGTKSFIIVSGKNFSTLQ